MDICLYYNLAERNRIMWKVRIFTLDSEYVDSADDIDCIESILYGDLSYYEGPRIIQIPMNEEELIEQVQRAIAINADCFGLEPDRIELVLC